MTPLSSTLEVLALARQLETTLGLIRQFDQVIAQLVPELPDYSLFASLPGAGPILTPRLLTAFGENRDRFHRAAGSHVHPIMKASTYRHSNDEGQTWFLNSLFD